MRHATFSAPLAAVGFLLSAACEAGAATAITSTFDTGSDGWRFGAGNFSPQAVTWDAQTQSIGRRHGFTNWGFLAPSAYLGDKSAYVGGTFSFELAARPVDYADRPLLVLTSLAGETIYSNWGAAPGATLTPFEVELTARNFYRGTADTQVGSVSDAQFAALMGNLRSIVVFGDWTSNVDEVRLDNVAMRGQSAAVVPEPATWGFLIAGFGIAGAALRRRTPRTGLDQAGAFERVRG